MKRLFLLVPLMAMLAMVGCRPYGTPIVEEVSPSQTAYVFPLDEDLSKQQKFNSIELLNKNQVASRRIEVPVRWLQTGYWWMEGRYLPTQRVIKVERKPVTREWKDIAAEDSTSIGFLAEITCVAFVPEDKTSMFLYNYNNKPLEEIMDQEIRSRITGKLVEQCAKRTLHQIFVQKSEIMDIVREHTIKYYEDRGVRITNLELKGNLTFESDEVQKAIDAVFTAAQKKKEQEDLNAAARAKAESDKEIASQLSGPVALKLKELDLRKQELENQKLWIEAWGSGKAQVPQIITGGNGAGFILQMPAPAKR